MSDLSYNVRAPLCLELQSGEVVHIREWSLNGLMYPQNSELRPRKGVLGIPFQGVDIRFEVKFLDGGAQNELLFDALTGRQREILGIFYRSILSGKMAASEDMITSLDTPVDLVPMGETEEEEAAGKAKSTSRSLRVVWNVLFYILLGTVLFWLIGGQIWGKLSSVPLVNARVIAPVVMHRAPEAAYADDILVAPGTHVLRGQTLARLSNPDRDSDMDDIRRDILRAERDVTAARRLFFSHIGAADKVYERLLAEYEAALAERVLADFLGGYRLSRVTTAWRALQDFIATRADPFGEYQHMHRQLQAQLTAEKDALRRLRRDLGNAKEAARAMDIVAAFDGVVSEVLVLEDQFLGRGQEVITLEEDRPRYVQAWLNEARSDAVFVGMEADVVFRSETGKRTYSGIIADITAGMDPTTDNGFGMIVSVDLAGFDLARSRTELRADAPVKLRALKAWHRPAWLP